MIIFPAPNGGGGGGGDATNTVLSLAYDPNAVSNAGGVYKTFAGFWSAYLASKGPVELYVAQGFSPPPGTYPLRRGTRVRGPFNQYGAVVQIAASSGVFLEDWLHLDAVQIQNNSDTSCMTFSGGNPNPTLLMENGAVLAGNTGSAVPVIEWTEATNVSILNIDLQSGSQLQNQSGPAITLTGSGPGNDKATVNVRLGQRARVNANTIFSNVDAALQLDLADGKGFCSFDQPNYNGDNSPLDPDSQLDYQFEAGVITRSFSISHPSGGGAPQWLQLVRTIETTDDTPTAFFPVQAPPPVISAGIDLRIEARHDTTGDTAAWIIKGSVIFGFGGATLLPDPLTIDDYNASPGAASWTWDIVLNSPDDNNVNIRAIGENGKNITWSLSLVEMLSMAIP